jgi:hypothetical protein
MIVTVMHGLAANGTRPTGAVLGGIGTVVLLILLAQRELAADQPPGRSRFGGGMVAILPLLVAFAINAIGLVLRA